MESNPNCRPQVIECSQRSKTLNRVYPVESYIYEALAVFGVLSVTNVVKLDTSRLCAEVRIHMLLRILIILPIYLVKCSRCLFQLFPILNLI
uniref:Uncharacterized protein n=1 Tax=Trichobilharzia regenti TaxID=157069 RepID=A0AA85K668_TRIRE|nr:unnamed protein product [Trichobilharzia regenti]